MTIDNPLERRKRELAPIAVPIHRLELTPNVHDWLALHARPRQLYTACTEIAKRDRGRLGVHGSATPYAALRFARLVELGIESGLWGGPDFMVRCQDCLPPRFVALVERSRGKCRPILGEPAEPGWGNAALPWHLKKPQAQGPQR